MKPIILVLSQRVSEGKSEEVNENSIYPTAQFVTALATHYEELFESEDEVNELLELLGQNGKSTIEWTTYYEILTMLGALQVMENIKKEFNSTIGSGVADFHEYINGTCTSVHPTTMTLSRTKKKTVNT
ncbi:uncharacterized protein LOC126845877 [Adelges cooleyi]|uniref:uncharacterized protein LOC126845877 n=1 Tax=Adelges cooleyi TaxID=133065 RepID=UPI00217FE414|nr:uncharacterized protein LOC126845877 [Adelges cooleyi]